MRRAVILLVGLLALAGCGETYYNDPDQVRPSTTTTTVERTTTTTLRRRPILEEEDLTTPLTVPPDEDFSVYAQPRTSGPAVSCSGGPCRPSDPTEVFGCWEGGPHACSAEESWAEMERRQTINELEDRIDELEGQLRRQGGYP